jgi:hypothetical protein
MQTQKKTMERGARKGEREREEEDYELSMNSQVTSPKSNQDKIKFKIRQV